MTSLPPDPENMNDACAAWAASALRRFQSETGTDDESALTALLCDFMHWSDRSDSNFDEALGLARLQYQAEIASKPAGDSGLTITMVRTTVAPPGKVDRLIPYWLRNIHQFVALDIQPHIVMRENPWQSYLEPCAPQDADAWLVNGRYPSGEPEPFEHFDTTAEARTFRDQLVSLFPHLGGRTSDGSDRNLSQE